MAAAQKPAAKAATETTSTGVEVQTSSLEQDLAGQVATPPEQAPQIEPQVDPRNSALAALVNQTADPVIPEDAKVEIDTSNVIDFGGRTKAVVKFSRYNQLVDGKFKQARKGDVIATTAEDLKRGERIGALKKLD